MIAVCDYGIGNVQSVLNGFERIGVPAEIFSDPAGVMNADGLLVPGVGAFGDAIRALRRRGFETSILEFARTGRPVLGICVGMQLLADVGHEFGEHRGLGLISGSVDKISFTEDRSLVLPHMGWNDLKVAANVGFMRDLPGDKTCYFAHSFQFRPLDRSLIAATVDYGTEVVAAIQRDNIFGVQFHPEKSQDAGLKVLSNFAEICATC